MADSPLGRLAVPTGPPAIATSAARPEIERYWPSRTVASTGHDDRAAIAVWLEPPADMGRPIWRDVLEHDPAFGPEERSARSGPFWERLREGPMRLWGRIAAKDAARRIGSWPGSRSSLALIRPTWIDPQRTPLGQAESCGLARGGRPGHHADRSRSPTPRAWPWPWLRTNPRHPRPGIDIEPIVEPRTARLRDVGLPAASERALARPRGAGQDRRDEWVARFWCVKEATAKATGLGFVDGPVGGRRSRRLSWRMGAGRPELLRVDADHGLPRSLPGPIRVRHSIRRGDHRVWAWTLGEREPNDD